MNRNLNKFEQWMLRRIFRERFIQSRLHKTNISDVMRIVAEAVRLEFNEDNTYTRYDFLLECLTDGFTQDYEGNENIDLSADALQRILHAVRSDT